LKTEGVALETDEQRARREARRRLFDQVADLYEETRQGYPREIVDTMLTTAGVGPGAAVLEIGCGTGQLTGALAGRGLRVTALDIGPAMVAATRRRVTDPLVSVEHSSFEDHQAEGPFDLIVSATAFHWVDPTVGWEKAARLLRPTAGWLALLTTGERYRDPLRTSLRELWVKYSRQSIAWTDGAPWAEPLRASPLFGDVVEGSHECALTLPAEAVVGVECTRATFLSYSSADRDGFRAELEGLLSSEPTVDLVQETHLAMAPVADHPTADRG
jgi:2-polyprenyl-3-methyl-5-hydroxy-6-metoxy-1,4-benzoquinol methylase